MSLTTVNGNLEIIDYTDQFYSAGENYVDLFIYIPPEGINETVSWTVDDGIVQLDADGFVLNFSSGPQWYYARRVYVNANSKVFNWHFSDASGERDFSVDLLVGQIPIAFIKQAPVWKRAIPYVKSDGVWKQANPKVHAASGWSDTTG